MSAINAQVEANRKTAHLRSLHWEKALFFFLPFFVAPAFAASYDIPIQEGDRILIKGLAAQVQLISQPVSGEKSMIRVSGVDENSKEAGKWSVDKKDHVIEIKMNDFDSKKEWKDALGKANHMVRKIEVTGPALPVDVHLRDGSVNLQRWSKEAKINLIQGRITSTGGSGALQAHLQKGDVTVNEHNGKVSADSYSGNMGLRGIQGDVDAQLFAGTVVLEKIRGFISLNSQQSTAKINQSSGSLQFENGKGPLNIQNYQGRIEGQTGEGSLTVSFMPESELNLRSKSGRVSIQAPTNSGASLNLLTIDGDIIVPKELRVNRLTSEKSVRGRMRGEAQKGSVFVRSQEGVIVVK